MQEPDLFPAYCAAVCAHVRCRLVRKAIAAELDAHLEDHAAALRAEGAEPTEAARLAVEAMGDPKEVGEGLDRLYPPVLYWLVRILGCAAAGLLVTVVVLAGARTSDQNWYGYELFSADAFEQQLFSYNLDGSDWAEELVSTGYVAGGGSLGDYDFAPGSEAWLVYSPPFPYSGGWVQPAYYELRFTLAATHWQPWLDDLNLQFASHAVTDGAGTVYRQIDEQVYLSVWATRRTPFLSTVDVRFRTPDPTMDAYTFSFSGADGRAITFDIKLTDWEVTP